jgi:hypothetical protein
MAMAEGIAAIVAVFAEPICCGGGGGARGECRRHLTPWRWQKYGSALPPSLLFLHELLISAF